MAKLYKNQTNNIDYFIISLHELTEYNSLEQSVCDECLKVLTDEEKIILIPILNEALDYDCGIKKVNRLHDYPEDRLIQSKRTELYKQFFIQTGNLEE